MNKHISATLLALTMVGSLTAPVMAQDATVTNYPAEVTTAIAGYYNNQTSLNADLISRFSIGGNDEDGGLVEIVAYNTTAKVAYVVAGSSGQLITIPMTEVGSAGLAGTGVAMQELVDSIEGFVYGDMSSISVNSANTKLAVALQAEGYDDDGMVALFDINTDGSLATNPVFVPAGKQPDALTFTPDGKTVLVANEGEPRMGYGEGVIDPEGSVTMIDVGSATGEKISFEGVSFDVNVLLKNGSTPALDFEPEYIACDNAKAYVALQENNAIAVLDLASKTFDGVYGLGLKNFGEVELDMIAEETIHLEVQDNVYGIYMPDGISMATINGTTYLFTANEGDGREWGDEDSEFFYCNEQKCKTSLVGDKTFEKKVTWFNPADYTMLDQTRNYIYGARSFSIWAVTTDGLTQVFDSGSDFEAITATLLPDNFNCSNDDISLEDRSGKKGCEPEYASVGVVDGKHYAFIGLERLGGIMVYDVTDPASATFVNYLNSRDYSTDIAGDVAPEGLYFVNAADSATGEALLLAANEVSGTLAVIEMTAPKATTEPVTPAEPVAPVEPVTPTTPTANGTYIVEAGDCLWSIAASELGNPFRWGEIQTLNDIANGAMISIGQTLKMPA